MTRERGRGHVHELPAAPIATQPIAAGALPPMRAAVIARVAGPIDHEEIRPAVVVEVESARAGAERFIETGQTIVALAVFGEHAARERFVRKRNVIRRGTGRHLRSMRVTAAE